MHVKIKYRVLNFYVSLDNVQVSNVTQYVEKFCKLSIFLCWGVNSDQPLLFLNFVHVLFQEFKLMETYEKEFY